MLVQPKVLNVCSTLILFYELSVLVVFHADCCAVSTAYQRVRSHQDQSVKLTCDCGGHHAAVAWSSVTVKQKLAEYSSGPSGGDLDTAAQYMGGNTGTTNIHVRNSIMRTMMSRTEVHR